MKASLTIIFVLLSICQLDAKIGVAFDFGNDWSKVAVMNPDAYQLLELVVNELSNRYSQI